MNRKTKAICGGVLILLAAALCGMIFASIGTPCETKWWQDILLLVGSWCVLSKGWGYIVDGLGLSRPSSAP